MQGGGGLYKALNCDKFAANKDEAYNYYFKAGVLRCFLIFFPFYFVIKLLCSDSAKNSCKYEMKEIYTARRH